MRIIADEASDKGYTAMIYGMALVLNGSGCSDEMLVSIIMEQLENRKLDIGIASLALVYGYTNKPGASLVNAPSCLGARLIQKIKAACPPIE
jgi:hypothetical protein